VELFVIFTLWFALCFAALQQSGVTHVFQTCWWVAAQVHTKLASGELSQEQAQAEWLANRMDDPHLSPDGLLQIKAIEIYAAKLAKKNSGRQWVYVSCIMWPLSAFFLYTKREYRPFSRMGHVF
jgi:hypothetical protein